MEQIENVTFQIRIKSLIIDQMSMGIVFLILMGPLLIFDILSRDIIVGQEYAQPIPSRLYIFYSFFIWSVFFNKDIFSARCVGKRFCQLQVVSVKNGLQASPLQCLLRNLTGILYPVELIVLWRNPERRIGDFLAGTKISYFDIANSRHFPIWQSIISLGAPIVVLIVSNLLYNQH